MSSTSEQTYQDDVILRLRQLDAQYRSARCCCRAHTMTLAKLCGVFAVCWSLILCILYLATPLQTIQIVGELMVLLCAIVATVFLFIAINLRRPTYCWPFVAYAASATFYCVLWCIMYATKFARRPSIKWEQVGDSVIAGMVVWSLTALLYMYFTFIGYRVYQYMKAYRSIYETVAINHTIQSMMTMANQQLPTNESNQSASTDPDDVILSIGQEIALEEIRKTKAEGRQNWTKFDEPA